MPDEGRVAVQGITRRRLLAGGVSLAALSALGAAACKAGYTPPGLFALAGSAAHDQYRSQPDLRPPGITTEGTPGGADGSLVFVTQTRPIIADLHGEPVWVHPGYPGKMTSSNLRVQRYRGRPVLTWWEGLITHGFGHGEYVLLDTAYREVARVRAGHGMQGDLHEFLLTPEGTALFTVYTTVPADLSAIGGPRDGLLLDSGYQEVDVATGKVVGEWFARDHVDLAESYRPMQDTGTKAPGFDHFHANGLAVDADGDLLLSSRHTWTVFKISRHDGSILWRMGGKRSDFAVEEAAQFAWQHHITAYPDGSVTLFDNHAGPLRTGDESRGLHLAVDHTAKTVTVRNEYRHPDGLLATSQGSVELLADGGAFVGWGSVSRFSGFTPDAKLRYDGHLGEKDHSYRAFRQVWRGHPAERPRLVAERLATGKVRVAASWNGATDVHLWQLRAGADADALQPLGHVARTGFETVTEVITSAPLLAARAVDRNGRVLGTARPVRI